MSTPNKSKWSHLFPEADRLLAKGSTPTEAAASLTRHPKDQKALRMALYQRQHRAGLSSRPYVSRSHLHTVVTLLLGQGLTTKAIADWLLAGLAAGDNRVALCMMIHRLKPKGWRGTVREVKPEHLEGFTA